MFLEKDRARELFETRVDWWTLTFFLLLFSSVGALKYVGVTDLLGKALFALGGGDPVTMLAVVLVATGVLSAVLDNVLAVAIFIPVVSGITSLGIPTEHLWWGMLFGGTLFGNLTIVGSTANIVAVGMLERRKLATISLGDWLKPGALVVLATSLVAFLLIAAQLSYLT